MLTGGKPASGCLRSAFALSSRDMEWELHRWPHELHRAKNHIKCRCVVNDGRRIKWFLTSPVFQDRPRGLQCSFDSWAPAIDQGLEDTGWITWGPVVMNLASPAPVWQQIEDSHVSVKPCLDIQLCQHPKRIETLSKLVLLLL